MPINNDIHLPRCPYCGTPIEKPEFFTKTWGYRCNNEGCKDKEEQYFIERKLIFKEYEREKEKILAPVLDKLRKDVQELNDKYFVAAVLRHNP